MSKVNLRLVAPTKRYRVRELAERIGYSVRAIYDMIKAGLPYFTSDKKYKILGEEFIEFIKKRRAGRKIGEMRPNEMHCFTCKTPKKPLNNKVKLNDFSKDKDKMVNAGTILLIGKCPNCQSIMYRFDNINNLEKIKSTFNIVEKF